MVITESDQAFTGLVSAYLSYLNTSGIRKSIVMIEAAWADTRSRPGAAETPPGPMENEEIFDYLKRLVCQ